MPASLSAVRFPPGLKLLLFTNLRNLEAMSGYLANVRDTILLGTEPKIGIALSEIGVMFSLSSNAFITNCGSENRLSSPPRLQVVKTHGFVSG